MNPHHDPLVNDIIAHPIPVSEIDARILKESLRILENERRIEIDKTVEPTRLTEFGKIVVKRFSLDTDALAQGHLRVVDAEAAA